MEIRLQRSALDAVEADVLVVVAFDKDGPRDSVLNGSTNGWSDEVYTSGEFQGKPYESVLLHRPAALKAKRLLLIGAGAVSKWDAFALRRVAGAAARILKDKSLRNVHFALQGEAVSAAFVQAAIEGAIMGDYEPDQLKTDERKGEKRLVSFTLVLPEHASAELEQAAKAGEVLGNASNLTRDLQNEPSNLLTPLVLAEKAKQTATQAGLECEVLYEDQMRELGMGSLLGVAQGSENPPAFIIIRYVPETEQSTDHLAIIGKGVTFDSGGISIKPADGMEKMKYDMSGGAAAIGAMSAIAQLKPSVRVTAFIPTVENMINGRAQRPGDIVKSLNGKTVEVLNTDAEGRLILIDAITYALRQGCTHMIDAATLTGAVVVALGHVHIGAFANNDQLLAKVESAGAEAGERMWRLPLDDDYNDYLKSAFADLPNIGGRWGGAITAAKFLEAFVEGKPWVHLDIAGTAWLDDGKPWMSKGPSGVPMRTFVNLALNWAS